MIRGVVIRGVVIRGYWSARTYRFLHIARLARPVMAHLDTDMNATVFLFVTWLLTAQLRLFATFHLLMRLAASAGSR